MKSRLIVALDVSEEIQAERLIDELGDSVEFYKVGMQLFYGAGSGIIKKLQSQNKKVFLDLKFHDIPNTVAGAIKSLGALGVDMLTIHTQGGPAMMEAAVKARDEHCKADLKIMGVTVLTSISETEGQQLGWKLSLEDQVCNLASLAKNSGLDGIVASPQESQRLKSRLGASFQIVTPGIRPVGSAKGDQSRIATPSNALAAGSDYLVVGRPITEADKPQEAAELILREMNGQ